MLWKWRGGGASPQCMTEAEARVLRTDRNQDRHGLHCRMCGGRVRAQGFKAETQTVDLLQVRENQKGAEDNGKQPVNIHTDDLCSHSKQALCSFSSFVPKFEKVHFHQEVLAASFIFLRRS
ncbi:unnamed protein product [Pleuronectes platessa]|uniref:Uncharacterized protein n=1 Tax=Pleuronectes platessa TaxID=8262 RepID=A0A9N7VL69_PLEPL|nr:unnamed protein product [Pleuronectes platessa]